MLSTFTLSAVPHKLFLRSFILMYSVKRSYAALHYLGCIRILVVIYSRVKDESGNPRIKLKRVFFDAQMWWFGRTSAWCAGCSPSVWRNSQITWLRAECMELFSPWTTPSTTLTWPCSFRYPTRTHRWERESAMSRFLPVSAPCPVIGVLSYCVHLFCVSSLISLSTYNLSVV